MLSKPVTGTLRINRISATTRLSPSICSGATSSGAAPKCTIAGSSSRIARTTKALSADRKSANGAPFSICSTKLPDEPELTLSLPRAETVGTAMNALAHCAEAMYAEGHNAAGDAHAVQGASLIGEWLPRVVEEPHDLPARTKLLEGAMHAGAALGASMLALGHAMAQALGGRYGLPHGAMNALTLPEALRFNEEVAPDAVRRFREEVGADVEELAALGGFERLRDFGVPEADLPEVAAATVQRAGAKANPRPASAADVEQLLHNIY